MDHSILESDDMLSGLLPPALTDSIPGSPEWASPYQSMMLMDDNVMEDVLNFLSNFGISSVLPHRVSSITSSK